jgi:protein FAM32A
MSFVGGRLKLKGVEPVKGGKKKKGRKEKRAGEGEELALAAAADGSEAAAAAAGGGSGAPAPAAVDRRTEAEKRHDAVLATREDARAAKVAAKSHRERIREMNERLASETEHFDLFRTSYTA